MRALFVASAAAGRPLVLPADDAAAYTALCLDYYLHRDGGASGVYVEDGVVTGYVMVALDHTDYARWVRPRALQWACRAIARRVWRPTAAAAFHRRRLWDGLTTMMQGVPAPMPAHVHLNVAATRRGAGAGLTLVAHADSVVRAVGLPGYFGEVNVRRTRPGRQQALERLGARIVHRQHNRTMSWLADEPVDRLTVIRRLDPVDWDPGGRPRG